MLLSKLVLVNHWLHLSAAALLVGGMIFLIAILRPIIVRNSSMSGVGALADETHNRFRSYVGILMGVLIFTGIINALGGVITGVDHIVSSGYVVAIRIKVVLAICLFTIYGVNAFLIKEPKGAEGESCSCIISPPIYKKILQAIALVLVFSILFLAVMLRSL